MRASIHHQTLVGVAVLWGANLRCFTRRICPCLHTCAALILTLQQKTNTASVSWELQPCQRPSLTSDAPRILTCEEEPLKIATHNVTQFVRNVHRQSDYCILCETFYIFVHAFGSALGNLKPDFAWKIVTRWPFVISIPRNIFSVFSQAPRAGSHGIKNFSQCPKDTSIERGVFLIGIITNVLLRTSCFISSSNYSRDWT